MSIQTYTEELHASGLLMIPLYVFDDNGNLLRNQCRFYPGNEVTHVNKGGKGIVVAVVNREITVLWSIEPSSITNRCHINNVDIAKKIFIIEPLQEGALTYYYR